MTTAPHTPQTDDVQNGVRVALTLLQTLEESRAYRSNSGHLAQIVSTALAAASPSDEALIEAVSALLLFMYGERSLPSSSELADPQALLHYLLRPTAFARAASHGISPDRAIGWLEALWRRAPDHAVILFDRLAGGGVLAQPIVTCRSTFPDDPWSGYELLLLLLRASKSEPTGSWVNRWRAMRERMDGERLCALLLKLAMLEMPFPAAWGSRQGDPSLFVARGALWTLAGFPDDEVRSHLARTAFFWSQSGQGSPALGTAAIRALAQPGDEEAARRLLDLKRQISHRVLRARIEEALAEIAASSDLSPDELADRQVPDHNLNDRGERAWDLEGYRVILRITSTGSVEREITGPDGRTQKSLPPSVRHSNPEAWTAIVDEGKALKATLSAQRARLEEAMISGRTWTAAAYSETFGRHPVLASLARRLVWQLFLPSSAAKILAMPAESGWKDVAGETMAIPDDALLSIVHPVSMPDGSHEPWQRLLVEERVVQPFKQLFRETYVVTPAEEESGIISSRFAGFPVPMSRIYALTRSRGWSGPLGQTFFDGSGEGWREFSEHGVRAVLRHGVDVSTVAAIESVHFERRLQPPGARRAGWEPIPLRDVPRIPFSEAMRDIDLVVSLATLGTEAQWREWEAAREAGRPHWIEEIDEHRHSWAQTGESRAALLTQILPALGLSERVSLRGHFAFVRGRRHEYRIHLGTGNIHVEPSGRYLCIVPRPERDRIFLPFEEDDLKTSEIISKIRLLAGDDSIQDPRILRQLSGE